MRSSTREIRWRLLSLLAMAFIIVLGLSFFLFIGVTGYFLTSFPSNMPLPFASTLEGYYFANGNWDGVEALFEATPAFDEMHPLLLDEDRRIILDHSQDSTSTVGAIYEIHHRDIAISLKVNGEQVGYLIFTKFSLSSRFGLARAILLPIGIISVILVMFLVIVAILLMRRFVDPLADVIYAARSVADGKLDTRIPTEGPQDLRRLAESFNEMASSLELNDRERRDMLADIAHELRTPLSVIRGRLEGIVDGVYSETGTPVSTALAQTYLLERLVDDLRLLTLAESRQLHFESKPVDLGNLAQHVIDLFQAEAREKNISLTVDCPSENLTIPADAQRTEQVIANLVSNALRYVPEGGRVWIKVSADGESVRLSVNDNGKGVPEKDLPFIFERFWRKDKSRSRISGGTGLGLAIAKQLVEAQGGWIEACNRPEGGLQVLIELNK